MEKQQSSEALALEQQVTDALRSYVFSQLPKSEHIAQVLVLPTFEPHEAWDVYSQEKAPGEREYSVVHTRWRKDLDLEKLRSPVERLKYPAVLYPTIEVVTLMLDRHIAQGLLAKLAMTQIFIRAAPDHWGLDGTMFELMVGSYPWAACRFVWWESPPPAWSELKEIVDEMLRIFQSI